MVGNVQSVVHVHYSSAADNVVSCERTAYVLNAIFYSDWHEFGTGLPGNIIATIAFVAWNNLMLLLVARFRQTRPS